MMMSEALQKQDYKKMVYPKLILSAVDSLVSLLVSLVIEKGRTMSGFSGRKCFASWEKSNQGGYWAKMSQDYSQLLMFPGREGEHSEPYCITWPRWGIVSGGRATELVMSVRRIKGKGYSLWPTPRANDAEKRGAVSDDARNGLPAAVKYWPTPKSRLRGDCPSERNRNTPDLESAVKMWPTPTRSDVEKWSYNTEKQSGRCLEALARTGKLDSKTGQLNADWVECLMGVPIGWTAVDCKNPIDWPGWPAPPNGGRDWMTPGASICGTTAKTSGRPLERSTKIQAQVHCINNETNQFEHEPRRVIVGQKSRAKRLKCLGNAVVPQQIYPIFAAIVEAERIRME